MAKRCVATRRLHQVKERLCLVAQCTMVGTRVLRMWKLPFTGPLITFMKDHFEKGVTDTADLMLSPTFALPSLLAEL